MSNDRTRTHVIHSYINIFIYIRFRHIICMQMGRSVIDGQAEHVRSWLLYG